MTKFISLELPSQSSNSRIGIGMFKYKLQRIINNFGAELDLFEVSQGMITIGVDSNVATPEFIAAVEGCAGLSRYEFHLAEDFDLYRPEY